MVKLDKIYTKGGDAGMTSVVGGMRLAKHHPRLHAIGEVDEANAVLGIVRAHIQTAGQFAYDEILARIQNDLFDLGAELATPPPPAKAKSATSKTLAISQAQVGRLESEINAMNAGLPPLHSFVLPGANSGVAAYLHLARAVIRRAERAMTRLGDEDKIGENALAYINRLSDHVFVMARVLAETNDDAPALWQPAMHA